MNDDHDNALDDKAIQERIEAERAAFFASDVGQPEAIMSRLAEDLAGDGLKFYEVRSEAGTFWIRAPRGSDATKLARRIMTADPDAVYIFMTTDLAFADMAPGPVRVTHRKEAEKRERAWIEAGRPGHEFTEAGEVWCRICGCRVDGIQHRADYPPEGML